MANTVSYDRQKVGHFMVVGRMGDARYYQRCDGVWTLKFDEACAMARSKAKQISEVFSRKGYGVEVIGYLDALAQQRAGCVRLWRPRGSDVVVGVYRGDDAGMDTDNGALPWSLVCEDHASILAFTSRKLAEEHGVAPHEWCEYCNGNETYEE